MTQKLIDVYRLYPYFFTALAGLLLLGIAWDSWPLLSQFYDLVEEQKNLAQQLEDKENAWRQAAPVAGQWLNQPLAKMPQPLLDQLNRAAGSNKCRLHQLQAEFKIKEIKNTEAESNSPSTPTSYQTLLIKMGFETSFNDLRGFLISIFRQNLPLRLDSISLKCKGDSLDVFLQFSAFPWIFWRQTNLNSRIFRACCARDPFQESGKWPQENLIWNAEILDQLHYVGYWKQQGQAVAMLLLPSARVYEIHEGDSLSPEGWQAMKLDPQELVLINRAGKIRRYRMEDDSARAA